MSETRYQRIAREQAERQAAREKHQAVILRANAANSAKARRTAKDVRRNARMGEIGGDHDYSMNA